MKKILVITLCIFLFLAISFYYCLVSYESYSSISDKFIIDKPYLSVVKSLATKESLEKAIEENEGTLSNKHWSNFTIEVPKRILKLRDYKLDGKLDFTVIKYDKSLGKLHLDFEQNIQIDKDIFKIEINLKKSQNKVLLYDKIINIRHIDNKVEVEIKSDLKIKKTIPYFLKKLMDDTVKSNNITSVNQLKNNLINITNDSSPVINFKRNL